MTFFRKLSEAFEAAAAGGPERSRGATGPEGEPAGLSRRRAKEA